MTEFNQFAPSAHAVFYRSYSRRKEDGSRENFAESITRTINAIAKVGKFTSSQTALALEMALKQHCFPSGRALWVAGTEWSEKPDNFPGYYNCCSMHVDEPSMFGLLMELAMMGTGTGAVLESDVVAKLPAITRAINIIDIIDNQGVEGGKADTVITYEEEDQIIYLTVGDSRQGWASAYQGLIELAMGNLADGESAADDINIILDLSEIRQAGQLLKGFGGTANPVRLQETFERAARILLKAKGRKLTAIECCLLIDEAASAVVAGNIRRCLPGNALVHTELGLVPIRDIKIGTMVQTSKGLRPVVDFFDQGKQVIYEIKTQDGSLFCSKEHKVAVLRDIYGAYEMVKAIDLKAGDRMVGNHLIVAGHSTSLPVAANTKANSRKPRKPITIPKLDKEVAYFLGYLHGNGNVKSDGSGIRITGPSGFEAIATRCSSVLQRFGFDSRLVSKSDASAWELTANGSELNAYFRNFKQVFSQPIIPDCILQGTEEIRWHYLGGLMDSDGSPGTHVLLNSVYPEFSHQIQAIYSSLGVPTRIEKRLRKNNHECELNAVGLHKQKIYQVFSSICTRYPCLATKPSDTSRNQHGFDKEMVKASIKGINWSQCQAQKSCVSLAAIEPAMTDLIPITVIDVQPTSRIEDTFDIEVKDIHEFYCNGYLVSNSAGMRQFTSSDEEAASAKDGLYKQDESGNWSVDPEKEALRMANHTRCFHTKPDHETIKASIEKQFWSGEGAIMYVPESIARANADLLNTKQLKQRFLGLYTRSQDDARQMLVELAEKAGEPTDDRIIQHRMDRYGLNPCFAPGTIVMTSEGYFPIESLVGKTVEIHDGNEWRTIDNFRVTAHDQDVYDVTLHDGTVITATEYHKFILKDGTRVELKDLKQGDELMAATIEPVTGTIQAHAAYLKGFLIGDGTSDKGQRAACKLYSPKKVCVDRLRASRNELGYFEGETLTPAGYLRGLNTANEDMTPWSSTYKHVFPHEVLNWTTEAKGEFIAGLFDADGTLRDTKENGFSYQITSVSLEFLRGLVTLLRTVGIGAKIGPPRQGGLKNFGADRGGVCVVQPTYRLAISQFNSIKLAKIAKFERLKSVADKEIVYIKKLGYNKVKEITYSHCAPEVYCCTVPVTNSFTLGSSIVVANCGEIIMRDNLCNLSEVHLNTLDPVNKELQHQVFYAGGLQVAALLQHKFVPERLAYSRENDPIVGVSFTGLFDFFVHAFGASWLKWMMKGRPSGSAYKKYTAKEKAFLESWRISAEQGVKDYCAQHEIRLPNRFTTVQPAGSKSLLTGASSGWHPPKAQRFIRRITFGVNDPLVSALRDYGYSVIPAQSARDEEGNLLDDITDPRVREVLVEIPTEVSWANLPGCDEFDLSKLPVTAQWGLYMQVQKYYTTHNTSATLEFRENEIDELTSLIYQDIQSDGGYISAALLARFDANETFPRLPFEPIDKQTFDRRMAVVKLVRDSLPEGTTMLDLLSRYDNPGYELKGAAGCDSDKCLAEEKVPFSK
jgi:intein/homing endonuclease